MSEKIRFHLDESVNPRLAKAFEAMGFDCTYSALVNMRGATDEEQWAYVKKEGRILVTHDTDFLRMASQ